MNEQKYTNLNRIYYHGYREDNPQLKSCDQYEFYITTSFLYAASYAGKEGYVEAFKLKQEANILNLKSKKDYELLNKYKMNPSSLIGRDWFSYFNGDFYKRNEYLKKLKNLGYDGYFNYEIDDELVWHSIIANKCINTLYKQSPSIGIFNKNILQKIETINNPTKDERIKQYKSLELEYIEYQILKLYKNDKFTDFELYCLYDKLRSQILNFEPKQILYMIFKFNPEKYINDYNELKKKFGSVKLIEDKQRFYYERPMIGGPWL